MIVHQYAYIEQDVDLNLHVKTFPAYREAIEYAKAQLDQAISEILGDDFVVPAEHIDKNGFIEYFGQWEEITSSEWGWYVYDGIVNTIRGYIEPVGIEVDINKLVTAARGTDT